MGIEEGNWEEVGTVPTFFLVKGSESSMAEGGGNRENLKGNES